jgi:hypothetical protein
MSTATSHFFSSSSFVLITVSERVSEEAKQSQAKPNQAKPSQAKQAASGEG